MDDSCVCFPGLHAGIWRASYPRVFKAAVVLYPDDPVAGTGVELFDGLYPDLWPHAMC